MSGENILIADSGPHDRKRYMVIGSRTGIEFLANVDEWHVDGTFKTAPCQWAFITDDVKYN